MKMLKFCILYFVIFNFLSAIPRFAVKNASSCNLCHVSPTGAGLRNDYGVTIVSMDEIPMEGGMKLTDEDYSGMLGDFVRLGADLRLQILSFSEIVDSTKETVTAIFPMQADMYGHLPVSKAVDVYAKIDLVRTSPEFWVMLNVLPNDGYIQFGRKIPTYGFRLDDHTSFVRGGNLSLTHQTSNGDDFTKEGMVFSPRTSTPGFIEAGFNISQFFITASVSNPYILGSQSGSQTFEPLEDKNYTARIEYSGSFGNISGMAGASYMKEQDVNLNGIFGGASLGMFTWLGEIDISSNWILGKKSFAGYSEFIVEPVQGINLLFKYDFFDEDMDFIGAALTRYTIGTEIFPMSFLEIKAQIRTTKIAGTDDKPDPEYLLQLHTWF